MEKSTLPTWRRKWLLTWKWRGNFGNEIIKQWIVHEKDNYFATVDIFWVIQSWVPKKLLSPNWWAKTQLSPKKKRK